MPDYPPYINAYGQLPRLFKRIQEADVPSKFTQDFLSSILGLKSSGHRPMIPFLKRLGFIDNSNTPTSAYREYRDDENSKFVMGEQLKKSYPELYKTHEYAHTLSKSEIINKLSSVLGVAKDVWLRSETLSGVLRRSSLFGDTPVFLLTVSIRARE